MSTSITPPTAPRRSEKWHTATGTAPQARRPPAPDTTHPRLITFGLTAANMLVELTVGLATGSRTLLSDATHMGTDVLGLGMALAAINLGPGLRSPQLTTWWAPTCDRFST